MYLFFYGAYAPLRIAGLNLNTQDSSYPALPKSPGEWDLAAGYSGTGAKLGFGIALWEDWTSGRFMIPAPVTKELLAYNITHKNGQLSFYYLITGPVLKSWTLGMDVSLENPGRWYESSVPDTGMGWPGVMTNFVGQYQFFFIPKVRFQSIKNFRYDYLINGKEQHWFFKSWVYLDMGVMLSADLKKKGMLFELCTERMDSFFGPMSVRFYMGAVAEHWDAIKDGPVKMGLYVPFGFIFGFGSDYFPPLTESDRIWEK